jgi:hypothetical protein
MRLLNGDKQMKKEEYIARYGEVAYERHLEEVRQWEEVNPGKVDERNHNVNRKGGKYYLKTLKDNRTGLRGKRNTIRRNHRKGWRDFKMIIAPDSQIHHEWIFETADFRGVALVEANQHRYGSIDVIRILDGEITLFTEKEIREPEWEHGN